MGRRTLRTAPLAENLEKTLEKIGGENTLKRKYPELYKAVLNTREKQRSAPLRTADENSEYIFDLEDSCKIRTLNYTPDTVLESASSMNMKTVKPSLAIIGDITDSDTGESIDGFAVATNNSKTLSAESSLKSSDIAKGSSKKFIAKSSFIVIETDADGKNTITTLDSVMEAQKTIDGDPIVKELIVNDPMPIKHSGAEYTAVYYNRTGGNADYQYPGVKYSNDSIDVFMPFSGSVELSGIFAPDPKDPIIKDGANGIVLQIENKENGCANFDINYWGELQWEVTGSVLKWKFPDDWHNILKKNNLNHANNMHFYCKMYIKTTLGYPVPIVIQSDGESHGDPSYKKIPYINILWGCFAKDVLIRMSDGSNIPIERIKQGDTVMTKDSGVCTVTEVVTGTEDKLIHIKTASQNRIRVSLDHPMLTTEGMMTADKLTAGTIIITEDGAETIESLYLVNYADIVYNLKLDRDGILIANNFYAGDFAAQNAAPKTVLSAPQKPEAFQEELADLIDSINRSKKNSL